MTMRKGESLTDVAEHVVRKGKRKRFLVRGIQKHALRPAYRYFDNRADALKYGKRIWGSDFKNVIDRHARYWMVKRRPY